MATFTPPVEPNTDSSGPPKVPAKLAPEVIALSMTLLEPYDRSALARRIIVLKFYFAVGLDLITRIATINLDG